VQVKELRGLTEWSEGHVWVSPEMHGTITGVFKTQIEWLPLCTVVTLGVGRCRSKSYEGLRSGARDTCGSRPRCTEPSPASLKIRSIGFHSTRVRSLGACSGFRFRSLVSGQVNSRTHVPQKLTVLNFSIHQSGIDFKSPIQSVLKALNPLVGQGLFSGT
jgi:hypothetical protein